MAYRPTAKTEARKQAQLKLLIDSALTLVADGGFAALTMTALAERAGLGTGTVYRYFDSKAKLCTEVFRVATHKEIQNVEHLAFPDEPLSHAKRLSNVIVSFSHRAIAGRKLSYALIAEPMDPQVEVERLKYRQAYADIFQKLIDDGIEHGQFPPQNSALAAAAIVGILAEGLLNPIGREIMVSEKAARERFIVDVEKVCLRVVGVTLPSLPCPQTTQAMLSNA